MIIYNYQQTGVGKLFLKLFFFSFLLSLILSLLYITIIGHQDLDGMIIPLACVGSLFLTAILSIASFPGVLIARTKSSNDKSSLVAYFLVPVAAMISVLFSSLQDGDIQFYFIIAASYTLVSGFFYFKKSTPIKINVEDTHAEETI